MTNLTSDFKLLRRTTVENDISSSSGVPAAAGVCEKKDNSDRVNFNGDDGILLNIVDSDLELGTEVCWVFGGDGVNKRFGNLFGVFSMASTLLRFASEL